jgi:hypothetical protein
LQYGLEVVEEKLAYEKLRDTRVVELAKRFKLVEVVCNDL